jgi:hypothetical protein
MTSAARRLAVFAWLALAAVGGFLGSASADPERLRAAKELVFDKKYAEARDAWQAILKTSTGADADTAAFWVARCSESLGEDERSLAEYGRLLDRRPADRALAEEARTSRVGLAARLYKAGQRQHIGLVRTALSDPSQSIRYYAAFQLAGLGNGVGQAAVPVLKKILAEEKDEDILERAKLHLLRLDPGALAEPRPVPAPAARATPAPRASPAPKAVRWLRVRIYEGDRKEPKLSVNVPVALAELAFKSLPDDARRDLKLKGFDAANFLEGLSGLGPTEILNIQGDSGERIEIWVE